MSGEIKVTDKRRRREELPGDSRQVAPASLLTDEIVYKRLKPEQNFVHPGVGRLVIQEDSFKQPGRIFVPQKVERRPTTGDVLEVGKGIEEYKAGQKVVYGLYSGTVLEFKGWNPKERIILRVLSIDDILGTVDKESPEMIGSGT